MFRLVFKHQGTRYSFDEDSGALEELARQLKEAAQKKTLAEATAQPEATIAALEADPSASSSGSGGQVGGPGQIHAQGSQEPVRGHAAPGQGQRRRKRKKRRGQDFDGTVFWIAQKWLRFGSNAKKPRDTRPIVRIARNGPIVPVLPCTSIEPAGRAAADFYRLEGWNNWFPSMRDVFPRSWLCRRAESVRRDDLGAEWPGALPSDEVEKIRRWLRGEDAR